MNGRGPRAPVRKVLERRRAIAALAGQISALDACMHFKLKPRWKVPPVAWGRRS